MRVKRSRQFSKVLSVYARCFGLDVKNLEVFLDHTFVRQALLNHVNIYDSISNLVGRGFRLMTSSCVIAECRALGSLFYGTLKILEGFSVLKCRHEYNPSLGHSQRFGRLNKGERCFLFALASNDSDLRYREREVPGMPVMFIAQRCLNTEPIPETTQQLVEKLTSQKRLHQIEAKFGLQKDIDIQKKKKKRGVSGPNPLSCRKKATTAKVIVSASDEKPIRWKKRQRALRKTWAMCQVLNHLSGQQPSIVNS
ncbi:unnamed protein product [Mesocestoides corti]|uniref:UTP23 sensor motif region domain-containing protein n=1 Tax=Mesocestoides corti TaxID=53468 RepID=A0A0R3U9E3_MESCO|nr:unnamed protein product [Mesocestoides corti]